ncbi:MAG TPA: hypothetical protein VJ717_02145, partial [Gemmatimonadaceae bacterium]|nr:hypothetical protein [Gemmatimonadaceae bacterium]
MIARPKLKRPLSVTCGALAVFLTACVDPAADSIAGPASMPALASVPGQDIAAAMAAQNRHTPALMRMRDVVGTAVGVTPNGEAAVLILVTTPNVPGLPAVLDNIPVVVKVTGLIMARSDPTTKQRPAPVGFSVGHPLITAGTIGARVVNS